MNTFSRGSRVCFVGDSITHNNRYVAHIAAFYREHFPELSVEFYNCGISGGSLTSALNTFNADTAAYKPTHIVLMVGINDSDRNALNEDSGSKYDRLKRAFDNYKINLDEFCEKVKKINAELTLCTPTPYAEYINSNEPPLRGGSALMLGYADYIKNYAKENGYPLCDYNSYITHAMQTETLYNPDRVHPTPRGHYYIAKCFLEFQGLDPDAEKDLPPDIEKWHNTVGKYRDLFAAEYMIIHGFEKKTEENIETVKKFLSDSAKGNSNNYLVSLAKGYLENKPKEKEIRKHLIDFMKNQ